MAKAKPAQTCIKCGTVVWERTVNLGGSLASSLEETTFVLTCQCDDLGGPRTASDE